MPSLQHEALIQLFRNRPRMAADLLEGSLHVPIPLYNRARIESGDLAELTPTEYRADAVVVLTDSAPDFKPALAIVVEVQRDRDLDKRWSWPVYLTGLRARMRCRVVLLVVCTDTGTAGWCANPIDLGHPGWVLTPLVAGPDTVPMMTDEKNPHYSTPGFAARPPSAQSITCLTSRHPARR